MNKKLKKGIIDFMNGVSEYIHLEYDPKYYREFTRDRNLSKFYDFVSGYYMGGNNIPDTARYVVDLIRAQSREENND
jgi:hypothetical protein